MSEHVLQFQPSTLPTKEAAFAPCSALVHRVRWHTGLSQAEFATTFRIDLDHLKQLEDGTANADGALIAYLTVIDRAPDVVRTALNAI